MATQFSVKDNVNWKARFFTIWGGQAISILGSQLVQFALIWYLTITTGSATVLATATMAGLLPNVVLGPFAGTLVDRGNRRLIMLFADSINSLAILILAFLFTLDTVMVWHIYVVIFIRALAGSFHSNAMIASTSLMVPVEKLTKIQGINQMLNGGLNVVAAPLGALLLDWMSIQAVLAIDVVTALIAILTLLFFPIPQPESFVQRGERGAERISVWQDFKAGYKYLLAWPGLLMIGLMTVGINFMLMPAFSMLPLLVKDHFGGSAMQLGWVESAIGIGIIAGGALLGVWGGFKRKILTSMAGLIGMGAGTLIIAAAPSSTIIMAIAGALLFGIMNPVTMGPFYAVLQTVVEPDMQARIFSLLSSVGTGITPIGLMIAGPIADGIGIQAWFFLGGTLCILMGAAGMFIPAVMNIEKKTLMITNPTCEPFAR